MDAVRMIGEKIKETAELTKDRDSFGTAKFVVFCNAPDDNPFMAGAFHGVTEADTIIKWERLQTQQELEFQKMIIEIYGDKEKHLYTIFTKWFCVYNVDKKLTYLSYDDSEDGVEVGAHEYLEELHYKSDIFINENRIVVHV